MKILMVTPSYKSRSRPLMKTRSLERTPPQKKWICAPAPAPSFSLPFLHLRWTVRCYSLSIIVLQLPESLWLQECCLSCNSLIRLPNSCWPPSLQSFLPQFKAPPAIGLPSHRICPALILEPQGPCYMYILALLNS